MDANLFRYIWRHTRRAQIWILFVILASMPIYFLSLDLPKQIVNGPIQGEGFATPGATATFLNVAFDLPSWLGGGHVALFDGLELPRLDYLVALSMTFLALVCVNGLFKFYINTFKGRLGERMLRRMRYDLVDRILRFPLTHFRRVKSPEIATMIKDEVEPLGGFIGDAFVQPFFLGGQALTAMIFILAQNVWLGLIAGGIVAVQAFIIPRLRRRLIVLAKQRQLTARELAGRVGELIDGISEVHLNDTSNRERADIASRLGRIFFIRYEFYQRKHGVKFLNNFLAQLTPFLFYFIGGYFALRGSLDIGQLVAVIAAYKDLPSPIKELIDWDQQRLDVQVKYTQVIEQFAPDEMMDPALQEPIYGPVEPLPGPLALANVSVTDETGAKLLEPTSFSMDVSERIAVLGALNSGGETVAEVMARLVQPTSGRVTVGGKGLETLPEAVTGRRIGYVGADTYFPFGSVRDALLYGLMHAPQGDPPADDDAERKRAEALAAGNTTLDIAANWIDYEAAGVRDAEGLSERIMDALDIACLRDDIFDLGLRAAIDMQSHPQFAERVLEARMALRSQLKEPPLSQLVEGFDPDRYNNQATVAENILFGTATGPALMAEELPRNRYLLSILKERGLDGRLLEMGREIAETVIELFSGLDPDHPFFEQLSLMSADEIPDYQAVLGRVGPDGRGGEDDQAKLMSLAFLYIEPRHRLGLLDDTLRQELVAVRGVFHERLPESLAGAIAFYEPDKYNAAASLQDNVLFGRVAYGLADGPRRVREAVASVLDRLDMHELVVETGLDFNIGTGGKRLTAGQRQKLALARVLIKRPDLIVVNRGLSALDARVRTGITKRLLAAAAGDGGETGDTGGRRGFGLFWILIDPSLAETFDRILVFEAGHLAEDGTPDSLREKKGRYAELVA